MHSTLKITKALSDIQRLRILMLLRQGELCVCQIIEVLRLAPSTVSKHLSLLNDAGLLNCRKDGRWAYFRFPDGASLKTVQPALTWLDGMLREDGLILEDTRKLEKALSCSPENLSGKQRQRSYKTIQQKN